MAEGVRNRALLTQSRGNTSVNPALRRKGWDGRSHARPEISVGLTHAPGLAGRRLESFLPAQAPGLSFLRLSLAVSRHLAVTFLLNLWPARWYLEGNQ